MTKEQATKMIADAQAEYSADQARVAKINRLHNEGGEGYQIEADSSKLDVVYAAVAAAGYYVGVGMLITKDEHIAAKAEINRRYPVESAGLAGMAKAGFAAKLVREYGYADVDAPKRANAFFGI